MSITVSDPVQTGTLLTRCQQLTFGANGNPSKSTRYKQHLWEYSKAVKQFGTNRDQVLHATPPEPFVTVLTMSKPIRGDSTVMSLASDLSKPRSRIQSRSTAPTFGKVSVVSSVSSQSSSRTLGLDKCLDIPRTNSSKSQEKLIEEAIANITKLPENIGKAVSQRVVEPKFKKSFLDKATRGLNIPKSGRVYQDLIDIETIPPIHVKRAAQLEPKPVDPSPVLSDYIKPQCVRILPPPRFPLPLKSKKKCVPNLINLEDHFDFNDLLQYERNFSSV